MVLWSVDTGDYLLPGVNVIVQRAVQGAKCLGFILFFWGAAILRCVWPIVFKDLACAS